MSARAVTLSRFASHRAQTRRARAVHGVQRLTRGSFTPVRARSVLVGLVLVVVGCGDDDEPPSSSLRQAVLEALCEDMPEVGDTLVLAGTVYRRDVDDCP